jgi:5-methylcytosine-specific restriction endonuclease McrA
MNLSHLTNQTLLLDTKSLSHRERHLTTQILWHLRERDKRRLYADLKYASLWDYVTRELGYSSGTAYRRISAARALEEMPELETKLNQGDLNLSDIATVLKEFKDAPTDKKREVFKDIENKTPQETKAIIESHTGQKKKITIEVDEETMKLIQDLKALKPHEKDVLKPALEAAIQQAKQQRFKQLKAPRLQMEVKSVRAIRRQVFARDQHRCKNCGSTHTLEIDHIQAKSLGGSNASENLRILCRSCNQRARIRVGLQRQHLRHPGHLQPEILLQPR